ncbi:DNA topoisomerase 2 [Orbilia oligospora]|nr:DNA topoisomerase 2 [Orbilia oligospora]KAF3234442.1 DNA topoisomerase 2 [Orbilia oligospora]KAF3266623.1 DNA topoisomerase 2 [Orbilia oligospora]
MEDESIFGITDDSDGYDPTPKKKKAASKPAVKPAKAAPKPKKSSAPPKTAGKKRPANHDDDESDGNLSGTPPKRVKKTTSTKKAATGRAGKPGKPLQDLENLNDDLEDEEGKDDDNIGKLVTSDKGKGVQNASDKYQKLSQEEHVLIRPDTYIGSIERTESKMWIHNQDEDRMVYSEVSFVPGLYKIFDEIIVNAADNKIRDPSMNMLKVEFDREKSTISVYNNGSGIPIQIHDKTKIYIPEMIFGHLLTGSNYDDNEKKVVGGRNGFGAKLCNIFSTEFILETADKKSKQKYKQVWRNNMKICEKAIIKPMAKAEEYTKVTFKPDLEKFGMTEIDSHFESLIRRRVYDLAGCCRDLKVYYNGDQIKIKDFRAFMQLHVDSILREKQESGAILELDSKPPVIAYERVNDRWEIGFAVSDGTFQQVSYVNSIATTSGGTHVNYVADKIVTRLTAEMKKQKALAALKPAQIKSHFFLFINCLIENPAFTSQTKEQLTTRSNAFGSTCEISDAFLTKVVRSGIKEALSDTAQTKTDALLKKTDGSRRARIVNSKLVDANKAGTKDGWKCTLILTEGDSAKALAMSGMEVVGRDLFGVFPLRGKMLNVRDAPADQIAKNAEIQNIKQILGLQHKKAYDEKNIKDLRYGHLMIMTDQDHDGSHIKGLLINFLDAQFPSLLKIDGFLLEFITPIVKAYKGVVTKPTKSRAFFTMPEYEEWKETNTEKGWQTKYYKGLGTSSSAEAKEYFSDLDKHLKEFHSMKLEERGLIDMVFSKKKIEERKEWLRQYRPGVYLDHSIEKISYDDFINKELILFSMADNIRSIPSAIDGLKPGQRKVLFGCFKKKLSKEVKVQSLAGYVLDHTHYQHGDVSLAQTIIALAQTFVGSNNVNILEPIGNFGSRLGGGKDAASARYISTMLSPFARALFPTADDAILEYNYEDGDKIEPNWYAPVLPLILMNGSDGIGTGWSSSIPNYNPEDVAMNIRRLLDDQDLEPMQPWYRGFKGRIERLTPEKYQFSGIINQVNDTTVEITELPVRLWTQEFKEKLDDIIKPPEKDGKDKDKKVTKVEKAWIKDYLDYNSDLRVHFIVELDSKASMEAALKEGLETRFKLNKTASTTNMVAFDAQGRLTRYETPEDILKEFYFVRLKLYQSRKDYLLGELNKQLRKLTNQARFVQMIIKKELVVSNKKRAVLIAELRSQKFDVISNKKEAEESGETEPIVEENEEITGGDDVGDGFNYLLGMPIWSLTKEKVEKLLAECRTKEGEIDTLAKRSPKDLWREDLDVFMEEWYKQLKEDQERATKRSALKKSRKVKTTAGKAAAKKLITGSDGDSDDDFIIKPKKARAAPKPAAPKLKQTTLQVTKKAPLIAKPLKEESDKDIFDFSDDDAKNHTPVKRAGARTVTSKTPRIIDLSDDDMEDDPGQNKEDDSDAGSPIGKSKGKISIAGKKNIANKPAAKKTQPASSDDSDEPTAGKVQAAKKRGRPAAAKKKDIAPSAPKAAKAAKATKQSRIIDLSDEETDGDVKPARKLAPVDSNSESDPEPVAPRARPGRAAAAKPSKYADIFDSDEESASEAEEEAQSDFDEEEEED